MAGDSFDLFVAGAGTMGHGIAQVAACAGLRVRLYDLADALLAAAVEKIRWSLDKLHQKGKLDREPAGILERLSTTTDPAEAAGAGAVLEAVPERLDIKLDLFRRLDSVCGAGVLFASNTSAIPITELAAATVRPDRFCGMHFFVPVPLMPLVEVVRGARTSDQTVADAVALGRKLGKEPVVVERDVAGFVVNRVLVAAALEAMRLLEAGVASAEEIDRAMVLGCGWKMGPLATADLSGLDVFLHTAENIHRETGDARFRPPVNLARLVAAGDLGRKTGRGIFDHSEQRG